jgi:CHASE3 domain sensor protein
MSRVPDRWAEFDQMIRGIGEIRAEMNRLPEESPEASLPEVAEALSQAALAVGRYADVGEEEIRLRAWTAIALAQDMVRHAQAMRARAQATRATAREMRERAVEQANRAVQLQSRAAGGGEATPPEAGPAWTSHLDRPADDEL